MGTALHEKRWTHRNCAQSRDAKLGNKTKQKTHKYLVTKLHHTAYSSWKMCFSFFCIKSASKCINLQVSGDNTRQDLSHPGVSYNRISKTVYQTWWWWVCEQFSWYCLMFWRQQCSSSGERQHSFPLEPVSHRSVSIACSVMVPHCLRCETMLKSCCWVAPSTAAFLHCLWQTAAGHLPLVSGTEFSLIFICLTQWCINYLVLLLKKK